MLANVERILIVHSTVGTEKRHIESVVAAVRAYVRKDSIVAPVTVTSILFPIPVAAESGHTLAGDLTQEMNSCIGAIVFVDDLRANVTYELGFFHGQGKPVLLVTTKPIEQVWKAVSDLAGAALVELNKVDFKKSIHAYLNKVYNALGTVPVFSAPELPRAENNMLQEIVRSSQIPVELYDGEYGKAIKVETWGGIIFDVDCELLSDAGFKIAIRRLQKGSTYSVYFGVRYVDTFGDRRAVFLGVNSNHARTGFEANERNLAAQSLTKEWRLLTGSFSSLAVRGGLLCVQRIEHLEVIRVRAGDYRPDPFEKVAAYEIGYFELMGVQR